MSVPTAPTSKHRARRVAVVVGIAVLAVVGVVLALLGPSGTRRLADGAAELGDPAFYTVPADLPAGEPGSLIRSQLLASAPDGTLAWRVLYRTTDQDGDVIVTSGVVVAPDGPVPAGGRPVVGWGHPTTGAVARCAPSNGIDPFMLIEGLPELIGAGHVVAAADYPGLGVEGPSSYLIGSVEGNSVLDSVRAARQLPQTGAGSDVLLWGHSQGGQAVLFAGQLARSYAPELQVQAVAAAAPAADLATLLDDDIGDVSGVTIGSYAFAAYVAAYAERYPGLTLESILTDEGAAATPTMAQLCLFGQNSELHAIARPLIGTYLRADPATTQPWADLLTENTPGGQPLSVPLLLVQGEKDALVRPASTQQFAADLCAKDEHVTLTMYPDATHGTVANQAIPEVVHFLAAARTGTPVPSTC